MRNRRQITEEWLFTMSVPARGRSGLVQVTVENVDGGDRAFVTALARVAQVWLNARRPV